MRLKRLFIGVVLISVSSLFYLDILISDFRVTFALVAMGAFLCLYRKASPIAVGAIISVTTFFIRVILHIIQFGEIGDIPSAFLPEMAFYVVYGIVIKLTIYRKDLHKGEDIFVFALFGDFLANVVEISLRIVFFGHVFHETILPILFLVALIRAVLLIGILKLMSLYRMLLIREDHELRYQRLIHLTMLLRDEMYWFEKNKNRIENSMAGAYHLFELLKDSESPQLAKESLAIASDIHEIKKEYEMVLRGFKEIVEVEYEIHQMKYSDMLRILTKTLSYGPERSKIDIDYVQGKDFETRSHFELMSILRNLVSNSIDALNGKGRIIVKHSMSAGMHYFVVEDDGAGIPERFIEEVFNPGYSSKIDYTTGEINRGLGLSLVKDLVENHFHGSIEVESEEGKFTRVKIEILKEHLEV